MWSDLQEYRTIQQLKFNFLFVDTQTLQIRLTRLLFWQIITVFHHAPVNAVMF